MVREEQKKGKEFYVYCYLDPRKLGIFEYGEGKYKFEYEPFYVGEGHDKRIDDHLTEAYNQNDIRDTCKSGTHKCNKIRKIKEVTGEDPIRYKLKENMLEEDAKEFEISLIRIIGREDKGVGPLTNKTDGGDGVNGRICTEEQRKRISKARKKYYENPINREKQRKFMIEYLKIPENKARRDRVITEAVKRPEVRLKNSISTKKYYEDPINRQANKERQKIAQNRPEVKEVHRERSRKWAAEHPEHMRRMTKASMTPESIKKRADKIRGRKLNLSPEQTEKRKNNAKGNTNSCKLYIVTTPNGEEIEIKGLQIFCKENNVSYWALNLIANGHKEYWYGWKARKI